MFAIVAVLFSLGSFNMEARGECTLHSTYLSPIESLIRSSYDPLFAACFENNKNEIPVKTLFSIFDKAKEDPILRMKGGSPFCAVRAYILLNEILKKGYRARLVHVAAAPVILGLIAWDSSSDNRFVQYGDHWVVAVDAKLPDGKAEPEILDPQFMDQPMSYQKYFQALTGRDCHTGPLKNPADCIYEEVSPHSFDVFSTQTENELTESCHTGSNGKTICRHVESYVPPLQEVKLPKIEGCTLPYVDQDRREIELNNKSNVSASTPIPPQILKLRNSASMQQALILEQYLKIRGSLLDRIKATPKSDFMNEELEELQDLNSLIKNLQQ